MGNCTTSCASSAPYTVHPGHEGAAWRHPPNATATATATAPPSRSQSRSPSALGSGSAFHEPHPLHHQVGVREDREGLGQQEGAAGVAADAVGGGDGSSTCPERSGKYQGLGLGVARLSPLVTHPHQVRTTTPPPALGGGWTGTSPLPAIRSAENSRHHSFVQAQAQAQGGRETLAPISGSSRVPQRRRPHEVVASTGGGADLSLGYGGGGALSPIHPLSGRHSGTLRAVHHSSRRFKQSVDSVDATIMSSRRSGNILDMFSVSHAGTWTSGAGGDSIRSLHTPGGVTATGTTNNTTGSQNTNNSLDSSGGQGVPSPGGAVGGGTHLQPSSGRHRDDQLLSTDGPGMLSSGRSGGVGVAGRPGSASPVPPSSGRRKVHHRKKSSLRGDFRAGESISKALGSGRGDTPTTAGAGGAMHSRSGSQMNSGGRDHPSFRSPTPDSHRWGTGAGADTLTTGANTNLHTAATTANPNGGGEMSGRGGGGLEAGAAPDSGHTTPGRVDSHRSRTNSSSRSRSSSARRKSSRAEETATLEPLTEVTLQAWYLIQRASRPPAKEVIVTWAREVQKSRQQVEEEMQQQQQQSTPGMRWWWDNVQSPFQDEGLGTPRQVDPSQMTMRQRFEWELEEVESLRLASDWTSISQRMLQQRLRERAIQRQRVEGESSAEASNGETKDGAAKSNDISQGKEEKSQGSC